MKFEPVKLRSVSFEQNRREVREILSEFVVTQHMFQAQFVTEIPQGRHLCYVRVHVS
jgi:hypothetical protein